MNQCYLSYPCSKYIHEHKYYEGNFVFNGDWHFNITHVNRCFTEQYIKFGFIYINDTIYHLFYKIKIDGSYEYCATKTLLQFPLCTIYDKLFIFEMDDCLMDATPILINGVMGTVFHSLD